MALKKIRATGYGIDATYWNIGAIKEDFKGQGAEVTFYGWVNKAARLLGKEPISAVTLNRRAANYSPDITRTESYVFAKTQPEFDKATDD